jgi:Membrane protein involved in the export of O-antigen and teichoic acid
MDRKKYLAKNIGILTISNFASKILVFLLVPLYTSVLSKEEVGIYDLVVSTVSLLYPIVTINIVDAVMRFSMDKSNTKEDIISISIRYIGCSWLIGAVILLVTHAFRLVPKVHGYEIVIFLYYVFYILYQLLLQFAKGMEQVIYMGIAGIISTIVMLSTNILFLLILHYGINGFFWSNTLALLFPSLFLFCKLRFWRYVKIKKINVTLQNDMLRYCIPLIVTTLGWWVNSTSDKFVVSFFCGVGATGLLSVAYQIPQVINTLQGIFIQAWQISAIKEYGEDKTKDFYGEIFSVINVLMCLAGSVLILFAKTIGFFLFQKEFFVAWKYVAFLVIACVINSASGFLGPILSAKKDSKSLALSAVYGSLSNILLNILLVIISGIQGATIATVISSFIIYFVRKNATKNDMSIENYQMVILSWLLLCIQAVFEIYTTLWWLELIIMGMLILVNWIIIKRIIILFKESVHI